MDVSCIPRSTFVCVCIVLVMVCNLGNLNAQETQDTHMQAEGPASNAISPVPELSPKQNTDSQQQSDNKINEVKVEKAEAIVEKKAEIIKDDTKAVAESKEPLPKEGAAAGLKIDTKSLLSITDGNFRISRIPGITIKENQEQIIATVTEDKQETTDTEQGLFGLSKKASDRLAKVILVIILIFVFILYRMRTRDKRGSVLRRFPK